MFTRRLVRLVLAPGALAYGFLAVVLVLIWLGVGARPSRELSNEGSSSAAQDTSAVTFQGDAAATPGLIDLEQAIMSARKFAGEPGLMLEGGLQSDPVGGRVIDIYYLESLGPTRGDDFFKVDARTAEVIEATFRSRVSPTNPPIDLGPAEAEQAAARYAEERFFGFGNLRLVDRSSRPSENNVIHSFKWCEIAPDSGAELPTSVSIVVSAGSGEVIWYLAQRDPVEVDVRPTIDRGLAIRTAVRGAGGRDSRWDTGSPSAVRLQVLYDEENRQQLVWSVTFRSRQEGRASVIRLLVNAHSGQLLAPPS